MRDDIVIVCHITSSLSCVCVWGYMSVMCREAAGGGGRKEAEGRRSGGGWATKNKNPTRRCGEKTTQQKLAESFKPVLSEMFNSLLHGKIPEDCDVKSLRHHQTSFAHLDICHFVQGTLIYWVYMSSSRQIVWNFEESCLPKSDVVEPWPKKFAF